jgi:hypothetical protein
MICGDQRTFALEIHPVHASWDPVYPAEAAGWAALSIWVVGENLCAHTRDGIDRVMHQVHVPLIPIADWLVSVWPALCFEERPPCPLQGLDLHDVLRRWADVVPPAGLDTDAWFQQREEWWQRHFLLAGSDGAWLPSIGFAREDDRLHISCSAARFASQGAPRFLVAQRQASVPWEAAELAIEQFVQAVKGAVKSGALESRFPWAAAERPLDAGVSDPWMLLRLFTRRSADDLRKLTRQTRRESVLVWLGLPADTTDPAASPITQVLRDLPQDPSPGALVAIEQLRAGMARSAGVLPRFQTIRDALRSRAGQIQPPEDAGQECALLLRDHLGRDGQPIADEQELLEELGVHLISMSQESLDERMVAGWKRGSTGMAFVLATRRTREAWGRRFEAVRALGHLLMDAERGGAVGAASSRWTTEYRRRRSGAFAAEFLLPRKGLEDIGVGQLDTGADPETFRGLMQTFGIGARTAAHQLYNRGFLSGPGIRDELIQRFSGQSDVGPRRRRGPAGGRSTTQNTIGSFPGRSGARPR